ncbi:MAG TPA: CDP-glycerol glycerophosphotransferase family protein [Thermodesulfobacteriota bacterium]
MKLPRWLTKALRDADDAIDTLRARPKRILFDARTPMNYVMWRPVASRLAADARIEQWHMAGEEPGRPYALYEQVGVRHRIISRLEAQLMRFDLYVCADFVATWLKRRVRRVHIFHGVAGKYGLDTPDPSIGRFDAYFFVNRDRLRRYRAAGLADRRNAYLIGMPKVDRLVDGSLTREAARAALGLAGPRPAVLYAPTWSPQSSLARKGEALLDALGRLDADVVVKLHDRAFDPRPAYSSGVHWPARLAALEAAGRVRLVRDPDATTALSAADCLVTDHSSIGFEYLLLDRPLVVVDEPDLLRAARVTGDHVTWLREAATTVRTAEEAAAAVRAGLADPTARRADRRRVARRLFYRPGTATDRAVAAIYRLLELAPPPAAFTKESNTDGRILLRRDPRGRREPATHASHA